MEDSSLANGGDAEFFSPSAASTASVHLGDSEEVSRLRKQLDLLSDEAQTSASVIADLNAAAAANAREKDDMARRIEELQVDLKALDAVAARANVLEGEVTLFQEELDAANAGNEAAQLEIGKLKSEIEALNAQKSAGEAFVASMDKRIDALVAEKSAMESKVAERDRRIAELEGLLASRTEENEREVKQLVGKLDRTTFELKGKETLLKEAQISTAAALEELTMLKELMEVASAARDAEISGVYHDSGFRSGCFKNPWVIAAASVGAAATVTATVYLHLSRKRLA